MLNNTLIFNIGAEKVRRYLSKRKPRSMDCASRKLENIITMLKESGDDVVVSNTMHRQFKSVRNY